MYPCCLAETPRQLAPWLAPRDLVANSELLTLFASSQDVRLILVCGFADSEHMVEELMFASRVCFYAHRHWKDPDVQYSYHCIFYNAN